MMSELSKSPERNTFQAGKYLERKADEGKTPENCEEVKAMVDYYASWNTRALEQEADPDWRENNMEYDLRSTPWILDKVRSDDAYAQNLYAAMCNNDFQKNEFMPLLAGKTWGCSWRYAGGIIADMQEKGDYIDWYCSGIRDTGWDEDPEDTEKVLTEEQKKIKETVGRYVSESVVTDEIRADLKRLGWEVVDNTDE
jgi:hypothetical protein